MPVGAGVGTWVGTGIGTMVGYDVGVVGMEVIDGVGVGSSDGKEVGAKLGELYTPTNSELVNSKPAVMISGELTAIPSHEQLRNKNLWTVTWLAAVKRVVCN